MWTVRIDGGPICKPWLERGGGGFRRRETQRKSKGPAGQSILETTENRVKGRQLSVMSQFECLSL